MQKQLFEMRMDEEVDLEKFVGGCFLACAFKGQRCPSCPKEICSRIGHAHQVLGKIETIDIVHSVVEIVSPVTIMRATPGNHWREGNQSDFSFEMQAWAEHPTAPQTICLFGQIPGTYLELTAV